MPPGSKEFHACGVCGRTILRGERITEYVTPDGTEVGVCTLCKAEAESAGWIPASLAGARASASPKRRRGIGLRQRLSRVSEVARGLTIRSGEPPEPAEAQAGEGGDPEDRRPAPPEPSFERGVGRGPEPSDDPVDEPDREHDGEPVGEPDRERGAEPPGAPASEHPPPRRPNRERILRRGIEAFNASAAPRKIAGLIRSLGEPRVTVRPSSGGGTVLTVAWELSWYQWEASGGENGVGVRETAKGSEIGELSERDQRWNATAAADGTLALDLAAARSPSPEGSAEPG